MTATTVIGLDVGRSAVKIVANANGLLHRHIFPSIVCPWIDLADEATAKRAEMDSIEVGGSRFLTGETARLQGSGVSIGLSNDWTNGEDYLALVASAMKRLRAEGVHGLDSNPFILVGTPASLFRAQKDRLEAATRKAVNAEIRVVAQPMGAYFAHTLTASGAPVMPTLLTDDGRKRSWAVIEIGHYTTDFLLIKEGQNIERSSGSTKGISEAAASLIKLLAERREPILDVTMFEAEQALRTRRIMFNGEQSVHEEVERVLTAVAKPILDETKRLFASELMKVDGVLLAGGGSKLLFDKLSKELKGAVLLNEPRMAVAEGFCRFGVSVVKKRRAEAAASLAAGAAHV